jgi:hypothetical protein
MKVRCNDCMAVFDEEEIIVIGETEHCPKCNIEGCLMDMENEDNVSEENISNG